VVAGDFTIDEIRYIAALEGSPGSPDAHNQHPGAHLTDHFKRFPRSQAR
jgi:hypothetical protein